MMTVRMMGDQAYKHLTRRIRIPGSASALIARIHALLRRPDAVLGVTLGLGNLVLDTTTRQARVDGAAIGLRRCLSCRCDARAARK